MALLLATLRAFEGLGAIRLGFWASETPKTVLFRTFPPFSAVLRKKAWDAFLSLF